MIERGAVDILSRLLFGLGVILSVVGLLATTAKGPAALIFWGIAFIAIGASVATKDPRSGG